MTLPEFLLARIAEDEAEARVRAPFSYIVTDGEQRETHVFTPEMGIKPGRVLAECEAKRRIVELHQHNHGVERADCWECQSEAPCPTILALASAYADHPEFREEWRA